MDWSLILFFFWSSFHLTTSTSWADLACWRYDSDLWIEFDLSSSSEGDGWGRCQKQECSFYSEKVVSSHSTYKKGPPEKESLLSKKWCTCSNSRFLFHSPFVIICIYYKSTYPGSPNPTASLSFSKSGLPDHVLLNIVLKKVLIVWEAKMWDNSYLKQLMHI